MAKIELSNKHLQLIKDALELYSRLSLLQIERILEHPDIENLIESNFRDNTPLKVGDETERGVVVEIGKNLVKTRGIWEGKEEVKTWTDVTCIKKSPDWEKIHILNHDANSIIAILKNIITQNNTVFVKKTSISNDCFDMVQIIRHEFWKNNKNKSEHTIDSSILLSNKDNNIFKVDIDQLD
jgi:hypothetical protein